MGSSKFDARAYPWPTAANERDARRLFAVFERLNREAQDDIVAAAWAASQRNGINPFDAIAELLVMHWLAQSS